MAKEIKPTGKVFVNKNYHIEGFNEQFFQLEVIIDETVTRLQAEGEIPDKCFYDIRHSTIKNLNIIPLNAKPKSYQIKCKCRNSWTMEDVNKEFGPLEYK